MKNTWFHRCQHFWFEIFEAENILRFHWTLFFLFSIQFSFFLFCFFHLLFNCEDNYCLSLWCGDPICTSTRWFWTNTTINIYVSNRLWKQRCLALWEYTYQFYENGNNLINYYFNTFFIFIFNFFLIFFHPKQTFISFYKIFLLLTIYQSLVVSQL